MLDKRMEWTVRRLDNKNVVQDFFSAPTLAPVLKYADRLRDVWGKGDKIKIQRRLVAHFREV